MQGGDFGERLDRRIARARVEPPQQGRERADAPEIGDGIGNRVFARAGDESEPVKQKDFCRLGRVDRHRGTTDAVREDLLYYS